MAGFVDTLAVVMCRETGPIHNATRLFFILSAFPLIPSEIFSPDIMRFDDLAKDLCDLRDPGSNGCPLGLNEACPITSAQNDTRTTPANGPFGQ